MSERTDTDERAARIAAIETRLAEAERETARRDAGRARVLALLESGYFGKALDLLHGKGD